MFAKRAIAPKAAWGCVAGVLALVGAAATFAIRAQADSPPADVRIALEAGLSISDQGTAAAFVLTNQGAQPFRTTPIVTNYNRLVIVAPDGKVVERYSWKDGIPEVVIEPSKSHTWRLELGKMPEFKDPGTYRVRWKIGDIESAEIVVVRESAAASD